MITKFETGSLPNQGGAKSSNTLLYIVVGALGVFLLYKYVLKPEMDKNKEKQKE